METCNHSMVRSKTGKEIFKGNSTAGNFFENDLQPFSLLLLMILHPIYKRAKWLVQPP